MPFISRLSTTPNGKDQGCFHRTGQPPMRQTLLLEDTIGRNQRPASAPLRPGDSVAGRVRLGHVTTRFFTFQSTNPQTGTSGARIANDTSCRVVNPTCHTIKMVEVNGIEPMTSGLQSRRSPS